MVEARACLARIPCPRNWTNRAGTRVVFGGCCLPRTRRRQERSPDSPAILPAPFLHAWGRQRQPRQRLTFPYPYPLSPNPRPKGLILRPTPACPPSRYAAAMSAQAQMRAMLDQLMGTSRDGKSLPVPWEWGRG